MYPPGHPSLGAAAETVVGRLAEIFESRRSLTIGVAHRQIVVEGVATDSRHAVLAELARKLHDQQIGVVSFERGTNVRELQEILQLFARDSEFQDEPVGLLGPDRLPKWEHARLEPVGYDELGIGMGRGDAPQDADRASQLWLGLAQAAMEQGDPVDAARVPEPNTLAHIIEEHQTQSVYDQVIVGYLRQLTDEIQTGEGRELDRMREHISTLIKELPDETLSRLVKLGGDAAQQRRARRICLDTGRGHGMLQFDDVRLAPNAALHRPRRGISDS